MTDAEIIVRTSVQVFLAKKDYPKPEGFGSGCIIEYLDRKFFVSVSHVTDVEDLVTFLETNQPDIDGKGPILKPVGGICYFDQLKVAEGMSLEDFEKIIEKGKRLDICFAEIKDEIKLLQPEMDFGVFKVPASEKFHVFLEDAVVPTEDERYGFYGKVRPKYYGQGLKMTPTLKHSLTYHRTKENFYMFLAPEIIKDSEDYEGCSGAPILDSQGRIVALACSVVTPSKIIYGFSIQECKRLLDYALQMGML
jgi:hypothetical protein